MAKIKILFLAANPVAGQSLDLDHEAKLIEERIRESEHRDSLELITKWAVRPDDLLQAFMQHQPHIVHFSGHGTPDNEIILQGEDDQPHKVSKEALRSLFVALKDNIRLVVLNACYSSEQANAITDVIDCAIGMQDAVSDKAAIDFATSLYRAIGFGRSVRNGFDQGLVSLKLKNIPGDQLPELHVREGVDSREIVLIEPEADEKTIRATAPPQNAPAESKESEALTIWREKLAFLQRERAICSDASQKFTLDQRIEEAKRKIAEFESSPSLPPDNAASNVASQNKRRIDLTIDADFSSFGEEDTHKIQNALADFLEIPPASIEILEVALEGGVRLTIGLPDSQASKLSVANSTKDSKLLDSFSDYPILRTKLLDTSSIPEPLPPPSQPVHVSSWQMLGLFVFCVLAGVGAFFVSPVLSFVIISLAMAFGTFGLLTSTAVVENQFGKFGSAAAVAIATLLILLPFRPNNGPPELTDIRGMVELDGSPVTRGLIQLLGTRFAVAPQPLTDGNPGYFEFNDVPGLSGETPSIKLLVDINEPQDYEPQTVNLNLVPGQTLNVSVKATELQLIDPGSEPPEASPEATVDDLTALEDKVYALEVKMAELVSPRDPMQSILAYRNEHVSPRAHSSSTATAAE